MCIMGVNAVYIYGFLLPGARVFLITRSEAGRLPRSSSDLVDFIKHLLLHMFVNCEKRLLASSCPSVRLSVSAKQLGPRWMQSDEISYFRLSKICRKNSKLH